MSMSSFLAKTCDAMIRVPYKEAASQFRQGSISTSLGRKIIHYTYGAMLYIPILNALIVRIVALFRSRESELSHKRGEVYYQQGKVYEEQRSLDEAAEHYVRAIKLGNMEAVNAWDKLTFLYNTNSKIAKDIVADVKKTPNPCPGACYLAIKLYFVSGSWSSPNVREFAKIIQDSRSPVLMGKVSYLDGQYQGSGYSPNPDYAAQCYARAVVLGNLDASQPLMTMITERKVKEETRGNIVQILSQQLGEGILPRTPEAQANIDNLLARLSP